MLFRLGKIRPVLRANPAPSLLFSVILMVAGIGVSGILAGIYFFNLQKNQDQLVLDHQVAYGLSIAKLVAQQSAEPLLLEDWVQLEGLKQVVGQVTYFNEFAILDPSGKQLFGSAELEASNHSRSESELEKIHPESGYDDIARVFYVDALQEYHFMADIRFQNQKVGEVLLRLPANFMLSGLSAISSATPLESLAQH